MILMVSKKNSQNQQIVEYFMSFYIKQSEEVILNILS